jgi:6-phosphogluconolactonase
MHILTFDIADFPREAANHLARGLARLAEHRESIFLALSGGRTPGPVYRELAARPGVAWNRIDLYLVDERAVPPDHVDSNFRMIRETLLDPLGSAPRSVHRIEAERDNLDEVAADYARLLPATIDLMVRGIGNDGHTASLFPGHFVLNQSAAVLPSVAPQPPVQRISLGPRMIRDARSRIVLATGADKAEPVWLATEGPWDPEHCPAQLARDSLWILDHAAAARLEQRA